MGAIIAAVLLAALPIAPCEAARADYEALSLETALEKVEVELSNPLCLEIKALSLMVLGRSDEADEVFAALFTKDVEYRISDRALAPSQRQAIESIRESVRPMKTSVRARWLVHDLLRLDVVVSGGLKNAAHVRYELALRPEPVASSGVVALIGRVATATAAIPAAVNPSTLAISGRVIARDETLLHSFDSELVLPPRPPRPARVERDEGGVPWFVWAGIGASLIGATIAIAVIAQPGGPPCEQGLGCVEVE